MPDASTELSVAAPLPAVWKLLNDPVEIGKCVPGCEEVIVLSPTDSRWKVKMNVGLISKRIDAKARVLERTEPSRLAIKIDSVEGDIQAKFNIDLEDESPTSTKLKFFASVEATGSFQWVINQVIKSQITKLAKEFAEAVSARLKAQN